nr:flagellar filament capping protein FliD [uncultured Actinoplanes sp.]
MSSSVDGLVSGLSTSSMISQLIQVEAAPQTRLKSKVATAQTALKSYQTVNSKLSAVKSAAGDLADLANWRAIKPASTAASVTAVANGSVGSMAGSLTFDVKSVAASQTTTLPVTTRVDVNNDGKADVTNYPKPGGTSVQLTSSPSLSITVGSGTPVSVDISEDASAEGISKAVNDANLGIRAYVVKTSATEGVLQFVSTKSGTANAFTISGLEGAGKGGSNPATAAAKDAKIQVGTLGAGGYEVTSSTNTFTDVMPGLTMTVSKEEPGVTVTATADVTAIADKFQALVDAANATLSEISTQSAYDPGTKQASPLTGDFMVRQLSQVILSAVSTGLTYTKTDSKTNTTSTVDFGSLAQLGIQLNRDGQLTFDAGRFTASYSADPTRIQGAGIALGNSLKSIAGKQSASITSVITGRKNDIDKLNDQISDWDVRLAARREALQKQYAGLESSLGKLKNQSSWLSGQLSGLS